jgi:hypothetical protein
VQQDLQYGQQARCADVSQHLYDMMYSTAPIRVAYEEDTSFCWRALMPKLMNMDDQFELGARQADTDFQYFARKQGWGSHCGRGKNRGVKPRTGRVGCVRADIRERATPLQLSGLYCCLLQIKEPQKQFATIQVQYVKPDKTGTQRTAPPRLPKGNTTRVVKLVHSRYPCDMAPGQHMRFRHVTARDMALKFYDNVVPAHIRYSTTNRKIDAND